MAYCYYKKSDNLHLKNDFQNNCDRKDILRQIKPNAVLILQSAGKASHNNVITEDDESGSYLKGSPENAKIIQNWAVTEAKIPQKDIWTSGNYSGRNDENPLNLMKRFLDRYLNPRYIPAVDNSENNDIIKDFCQRPLIYYTGHGTIEGFWHFTHRRGRFHQEVIVTPKNIIDMCESELPQFYKLDSSKWRQQEYDHRFFRHVRELHRPYIISQSCYSGNWICDGSSYPPLFRGISSALDNETSSSTENGSYFTRWLFGVDNEFLNPWRSSTPKIALYGLCSENFSCPGFHIYAHTVFHNIISRLAENTNLVFFFLLLFVLRFSVYGDRFLPCTLCSLFYIYLLYVQGGRGRGLPNFDIIVFCLVSFTLCYLLQMYVSVWNSIWDLGFGIIYS